MAPETPTRRNGQRYVAAGTAAVFAGALTYTGLNDPHAPGFGFPPCPFLALTGLYCPGCGGLRMTHDLLNGDVGAALVDNVFLLVGLPMLALWLIVAWRGKRPLMPKSAVATVVVAVVAWTVIRNMPGFPLVPTLLAG